MAVGPYTSLSIATVVIRAAQAARKVRRYRSAEHPEPVIDILVMNDVREQIRQYNMERLWAAACGWDGIDVSAPLAVFSEDNPFSEAHNEARKSLGLLSN